ncbi:hypothetical protein B9Z55_009530 [Caenorhabditis nigoni]|nr:hypothetical protein B9Z55_009530 [Caenorhabditis nigoni]
MEMLDIFLVSFLSKNMKKMIKLSQISRFKTINRVVYGYYPFQDNRAVVIPFPMAEHLEEFIKRRKEAKNEYFQLNVSGNEMDFRLPDKGKYRLYDFPEASFDKSDQESVLKSIHYYLLDFFGDSVDYQLSTNYYAHLIPKLPHLSVCVTFNLSVLHDMKSFEDFLSSTPVLKRIQMHVCGTKKRLSPESKLYQAEYIRTIQHDPHFPAVLRHFQGRQAFLSFAKCEDLELIEFVKRWKSGEAFQKLEYMKIKMTDNKPPRYEVLNAVGVKYTDKTKQPPTHTLAKVFITGDCKPYTDPIISHSYVVRESDNRVASVSIHRNELNFGVWNKTEDEFLKLMD